MGNPQIPSTAFHNDKPPKLVPAANGILAYVPGEFIGQGSRGLPPPQPGDKPQEAVLNVPSLGAVRITYEANRYKHGPSWFCHWLAVRAVRVEEAPVIQEED